MGKVIVGIGTDIIEINRVIKACEKERFLHWVFTEQEIALFDQKPSRCASNFAVKEAVVKVLGTGFNKITPKEIEVLRDKQGKPFVKLYQKAKEKQEELGITRILVTLSDTKEYVVAYAIGEADLT